MIGRRQAPRRRFAGLLLAVLALAGCGFQPLYGERPQGSVAAVLAQVQIDLISDRLGQRLHNALRDRMIPRGGPARPLYRLRVAVNESKRRLAIHKDETTARASLQVSAIFEIFDAGSGAALMKGKARATSSYNVLDSDFATLSAERDAQERAVRVLADEITVRVGGFLHNRQSAGG
ncbi:MAG: LPS assembly lipoprotein LptE [Alphaproteobacteria bacterium]